MPKKTTPNPQTDRESPYISEAEAVKFLGLRSRSSLTYLHKQPDAPPFIQITSRKRVYALTDLMAWMESRRVSGGAHA